MTALIRASQVAQCVKNLPAMHEVQETWVQFLGPEDPLEEGMATHSSVNCLENIMDRGACLQSTGSQRTGCSYACTELFRLPW